MNVLNGIRVVEFSHMVMGPTVGMILGDLGADVVKVEPIDGDKTRKLKGSGAGYFAMFNRNKRSIAVDLKSAEGLDVVRDLIRSADVMTENFRAGALAKLGLDYETVRTLNPGIVYQSSKGFLAGPYENRTALDEVAQMMGGLAYMTGPPGRPLRAGSSVVDITGGMFGAIGILACLLRRADPKGTGKGGHVTSALFESTALLVGQHIAQYAVTGEPAAPMPARVSAWAVYDLFDTADGQVFVGVVSDVQWKAFCRQFGFDDWAGDAALATNAARVQARPDILPRLRETFGTMTTADLQEDLEAAGLPFAPVRRPEDLDDDPHLAHGGMVEVTPPGRTLSIRLPKLPVSIDGERTGLAHDVPDIGADTDEILQDLGYDAVRIAALRDKGIIGS